MAENLVLPILLLKEFTVFIKKAVNVFSEV